MVCFSFSLTMSSSEKWGRVIRKGNIYRFPPRYNFLILCQHAYECEQECVGGEAGGWTNSVTARSDDGYQTHHTCMSPTEESLPSSPDLDLQKNSPGVNL